MNNAVTIVLICDNNYVLPTSTAIISMIESKKKESKYRINIISASLSELNENRIEELEQENVEIHVIRQDVARFKDLHTFNDDAVCVASVAALLKFVLAELLPEDDKVLYLDGDILVREDLSKLYETDIQDFLAGVVVDSGSIYYKHEYVKKVHYYFNSGVMLLNLARIRNNDVSCKLIETKRNLTDSNLMDQNVFNIVFDNQIKLLPIRYNFLAVNLKRSDSKWNIDQINRIYKTAYKTKSELFQNNAIIHFSSKDKPWKFSNIPFSSDWYKVYLLLDAQKIVRHTKGLENDETKIKVSIIIPVYNVEQYLQETLESALSQSLSEIEIICINDGSTDKSLEIIKKYQSKDERIVLVDKINEGQAIARNCGIEIARGKLSGESIFICGEKCAGFAFV